MSIQDLGFKVPADHPMYSERHQGQEPVAECLNEVTGMVASATRAAKGGGYICEAYHDSVGLVRFWRVSTIQEAREFVQKYEDATE